jgi:transcriptional regulator GlxA family with amidase domain
MDPSSCTGPPPTSGRNAIHRKEPAIVSNDEVRDDPAMASHRPHRVVSVLVDGMSPLEPSVAAEFFGVDRSGVVPGGRWYRHRFCTERPGPVHLRGGLHLSVEDGLDALSRADTVVIPGWHDSRQPPSPALAEALRRAHRRGARLASFCTGAFVLAHAGLLDGRRATTHWETADRFAATFPAVQVDPGVLYVEDGNILTSAGSAASIDLALHLVRRDLGAEVANVVARDLVVPPHRDGGQAQYIESPVPCCPETDPLAGILAWATAHLDEDLSVEVLAERAAMSPRNFARRFRAATGTTPHQWLVTQRVALAQQLLETTDLGVDAIADRCGFGTAASLRLHFQRHAHTSPAAYRRTFRGAVA